MSQVVTVADTVFSALSDESRREVAQFILQIDDLPGYAAYTICNPNGKWRSPCLEKPGEYGAVPTPYRLSYVLLKQMGRLEDPNSVRECEPGLPSVHLPDGEARTAAYLDKSFVLSGKKVDEVAREHDPDAVGGLGTKMYGTRTFQISGQEVHELASTLRYVTDKMLPKSFFKSVYWSFHEGDWLQYCSTLRSVPLCALGDAGHPVAVAVEEALSKRTRELQEIISSFPADGDVDSLDEARQDEQKYRLSMEYVQSELKRELDYRRTAFNRALPEQVLKTQDKGGFVPSEAEDQLKRVMALSLTELTSHCVQCIKGYLYVDGRGECWNQIVEKTPQPITIVSAAGIDFCTPTTTMIEGPKYFNVVGDESTKISERLKGFCPGGEEALYRRVKGLYRLIYRAFQIQGTRNVGLLPLGLGVFLSNVDRDIVGRVVEIYFSAQFDLLCEDSFGFDTVWLNAARYGKVATELVQSGRFAFKVNFVVHSKDAKFLAVELAKARRHAGMLNPSDAIAVMQGQIGYYWEKGRQDRYVGEEDLAATSTMVLQHVNIAPKLELEHVVDDEDMPGTPQQWCPVTEPLGYDHFETQA
eukprot:PhM_4_TR14261/c0_g1_i4/m.59709